MKRYDEAYFNRWYRGPARVHERGEVRRKVALAVAVAEYFLRGPVRSVLDVGCGEGIWFTHLRSLRRRASYVGVDSSDHAVQQFGEARNIRKGTFGGLPRLRLRKGFDLVVCSDVLHYLDEREIRRGLPELVRVTSGLAYLEVLTREDDIIGDLEGIIRRPAAWYRRLFTRAGLTEVGPYCWLSAALRKDAAELELLLRN
jgi:SAM-dependent methyltransferase